MKKSYDELFFTDDFLFSKIMRNPEIAKGVVENLLGIKVGKIKFLSSQYSIDEIYTGHGIRLDAYLEDSDKVIDIEIQTTLKKNEGLRMRYYQSMIDIEHLNSGENYKNLKESYIIFICLNDPFGKNQAVYNFVTREADGEIVLNDKIHKLFYNASSFENAANNKIKSFLSFIKNRTPSDRLTDKIMNEVDISKNRQPWRAEYMLWKDQIIEWKEDAREEGLAEGRAEGIAEGRAEGIAEGRAEGRAEGIAEGRAEGRMEGRAEGIAEEKLKNAVIAVKKLNIAPEIIAKEFDIDLEILKKELL